MRYVDKIARTSAELVLEYLPEAGMKKELAVQKDNPESGINNELEAQKDDPESGMNKELEAQKDDLKVILKQILADGLLEGKIEQDLIDEMNDLRKQLGSLEEKLAKMIAEQHAAELNSAAKQTAWEAAAEQAALQAAQAEAAAEVPAQELGASAVPDQPGEPTELEKLIVRLESCERNSLEATQRTSQDLQADFMRFKEETATCLTQLEGEMKNGGVAKRRRTVGRGQEETEGGEREMSSSEEDDFDVLERILRKEITTVLLSLKELEKRVDEFNLEEDACDDVAGESGITVLCSLMRKQPHIWKHFHVCLGRLSCDVKR